MLADPLFQIAIIAAASLLAQWLGWRFRIPSIVPLLILGFVLGVAGLIHPQSLLGDLFQPFVSVAVAIILFEGSLNLSFKDIKLAKRALRHVVLIGAPLGWVLIALSGHYIAGLSWPTAVTFGGLLIVTGPTVIMPLLRHARLNMRVGSILKWEGIINDPIGAIFAVIAYEYFKHTSNPDMYADTFLLQAGVIIAGVILLSYLLGLLLAWLMERGFIPEFLKNAFLLGTVVCLFVACNFLLHESGLIAVTVLGVTLANRGVSSIEEIKRFKETVTLLLVSGVFILLTATIDPAILLDINVMGIVFLASIILVARPVTIAMSAIGTKMTWQEIVYVSLIAPRGIVCAAVSGVLGPLLVSAGFADGQQMLPLAFAFVLITVVLNGFLAKPLGEKLGLAAVVENGLIIVGASPWAIQLAEVLQSRDVPVIIVDKNWHRLKDVRFANIPFYYGEALSDETDYSMELAQYDTILAATDNPAYNALVCNKFVHEFGRERVFQLAPKEQEDTERKQITNTMRGKTLAGEGLDYQEIWELFYKGWRFRTTRIHEEHNLDKILRHEDTSDEPSIFGVIRPDGGLEFLEAGKELALRNGDVVLLFTREASDAPD